MLSKMRQMKSEIESTAVKFTIPSLDESTLQNLRQQVLMHVPESLTPKVKQAFQSLLLPALASELIFKMRVLHLRISVKIIVMLPIF